MIARLVFSLLLLVSTLPAAAAETSPQLDDLLTPEEIAAELGLTEPTLSNSPQIEPFSPEQVYEAYGVDVYREFPVVIYVSKVSQTATVYQNGQRVNYFLISTGREQWETSKSGRQYFTGTPAGWFSPQRYVQKHWSNTWQAMMEFAIFFNGGIAVHATTPDHYKELGTKASGGCVRAHRDQAAWFWNLSLANRKANVPYFTTQGQILRNADGSIKRRMASGTLVIVSSY